MKWLFGTTLAAAAFATPAIATPVIDCPLRPAPFSGKSPVIDLLLSPAARGVIEAELGPLFDKLPADRACRSGK